MQEKPELDDMICDAGLERISRQIHEASLPAVSMAFCRFDAPLPVAASKLGGNPDLPSDIEWPINKGRPLDFLLQVNLADVKQYDSQKLLPDTGLLTFFYDINEQPWGFDPNDLNGFRVVFTPDDADLESMEIPDENEEVEFADRAIEFSTMMTFPHPGSHDYETLASTTHLTDDEYDSYYDLSSQMEYRFLDHEKFISKNDGGNHHLLGYSSNIQGDMQLEAQLVTNGLYCGDCTAYEDPRRPQLEEDSDQWILLLQLDSDATGYLMWGDSGMLYFWIRKEDLENRRFDKVWMALQCY